MVWLLICLVFIVTLIVLVNWPMRIPRSPEREGEQKGEAVNDYARMGRGPLFRLERLLVIRALTHTLQKETWLDIGCGPGYLALEMVRRNPSLTLIGLDNNPEMLAIANLSDLNPQSRVNFILADAASMPLKSNSLDLAVSSVSLHHWKEPETVFLETKRVLKPGGGFLMFDLRRDSPRWFYGVMVVIQVLSPPSIRRTNGGVGSFWSSYTLAELRAMLSKMDWAEFNVESHFGWLVARGRKSQAG
jgi:ubiquinone/menaquinone biosynthesis C-methylase UbiE